jgi:hypothetical protein
MPESRIFPPGPLRDPAASWLERLFARFQWREDIPPRSGPGLYMRRFFHRLISWILSPWGMRAQVHCFHRGDEDPDPHCHPWWYITVPLWPLWGTYIDEEWDRRRRVVKRHRMHFGMVVRRPAWHIHRVRLLKPGRKAWTFVITGRKMRDWGFWTSRGFVPHEEYLNGK